MAGICTSVVRDSGGDCEHLTLTSDLDGESVSILTGHNDPRWDVPLDAEEKKELLSLLARWWKGKGANIAQFVGRVLAGEEGTNVKQYGILTRDVTKTNIGTSYVNVPPGLNGERSLVEFTGCTEYRLVVHAVLAGTGPYALRMVRDSDNAVLHESTGIAAQAGEREFDTGIQTLPAAATGLIYVRFQAKSDTAADDPILRRCILMVR